MSQAKIDQYKKEKANRKANVKKEKVKKKITAISLSVAGVLLVAFLVWGVVATVKDGGLNKIKEQQNQDLVTQELINYLNSASSTTSEDETATDDAATDDTTASDNGETETE